jgi:hypothetical protein
MQNDDFTSANIWATAILQELVWPGEPEPTQASSRGGVDAQAPFGQPADLSETSHRHVKRAARLRESATTLDRANALSGGTRRHLVYSAENSCVATLCDYRGVSGFRNLKIYSENDLALINSA